MTLNIDQESCIKCGKCVRVCPSDIFTQERAGETIGLVRVESCIVCGHCVDVCPTGSVSHSEFPPEKTHTIDYSQMPTPEQVMLLKKAGDDFKDTQGGYRFLAYQRAGDVFPELVCVLYLS